MIIIACLSNDSGILFNNRRQSRDTILCMDALSMAEDCTLRMDPYSEDLFQGCSGIYIGEDYLDSSEADDYCFFEGKGEIPWDKVESIVLYRWNRDYPSDTFFRMPKGFSKESESEFEGKSHPLINKEVWKK